MYVGGDFELKNINFNLFIVKYRTMMDYGDHLIGRSCVERDLDKWDF